MGSDTITDYYLELYNFKTYVNKIHNKQSEGETHEGYFVDKKKYDFLENQVNYYYQKQQKLSVVNKYESESNDDLEQIKKLKMDTKSLNELKQSLSKGEEFILINKNLYKYICKEKEESKNNKVKYMIKSDDLIILNKVDNTEIARFKIDNNNIISNKTPIQGQQQVIVDPSHHNPTNSGNTDSSIAPVPVSGINDSKNNISKDIINFSNNEKKISEYLKSPANQTYKGFMVDKDWVDNWKRLSKYDYIYSNYIKDKQINEDMIQRVINSQKLNYNGLNDVTSFILKDINQINSTDKTYILLDDIFLNSFNNNTMNKIEPTNFIISNNTISTNNPQIKFQTGINSIHKRNIMNPPTLNNIAPINILNNNPNDANNIFLKHLLKNEYFKKDIYAFRNTQMGYALDSQIIKKLVSMHNLGEKLGILNTQANWLTYQNFENYYTHILKILNQNNIAPIDIQSLNSINEIRNPLIPKKISNLLYLDNFALIDNNFGAFLYQISNKSIKMYQVLYTSIGNKIVMSINSEYSNIYQIVSFQNDDFIVEYIIGISYNQYSNDIKLIHNLIVSTILTQGPQNLNILKNGIFVNNCFKFFLHELNNINKNLPQGQTINTPQQLATQMGSVSPPHVNNSADPTRHNETQENVNYLNNAQSQLKSTSDPLMINSLPISDNIHNNTKNNDNNVIGNNEKNLDDNLLLFISIIKERQKLLYEISQPNGNKNDPKKEYYLINKTYLKKISDDYNFEKIFLAIPEVQNKNEAESLNIAKAKLDDIYKKQFNELKFEDIQKSLNSKEYLLNQNIINNDKSANLLYYNHCDIISEKIFELLQKIDKNINNKCQKVACVFDKNVIIIFINNYIINIASFENYEIVAKKIIISKDKNNSYNLQQIFNLFAQNGYEGVMKSRFVSNNLISFQINQQYTVQANILDITEGGKLVYVPSERLKTMILLALSQTYYSENQKERVYLMNYKWLEEYKYKDIKSKINTISQNRTGLWNYSYDFNSLSNIINLFGQKDLENFDKKLQKNISDSYIPSSYLEPIALPNKYIYSYKKFVLINDKMYDHFKRSFGITFPSEYIYYIHKNPNIDFLCFVNYQVKNSNNQINNQNHILIGNINRDDYKFGVSQILDYNNKIIIEQEMNALTQGTIQNYILNRTCVSNPNDFYSPIFDNNKIIGNYYNIISKEFEIKKCVNYMNILSNRQLWEVIYLYINEQTINRKLRTPNTKKDEDFYFINKKVLLYIQTKNNYTNLRKIFEKKLNNNLEGEKQVFNILKSLSNDELKHLNNNLRPVHVQPDSFEVELIPVPNPEKPNEIYSVLDNFALIEIDIANKYLKSYPYHIMKCSILANNTFVIHYPNNKFGNKKYMLLVAKIDAQNNLINEYLIIYENPDYINHFQRIKPNLNNYLSNQIYINNTFPITTTKGVQIGTIVNLTGKQNITTPTPTPTPPPPIPPEDDIPITINDSYLDFSSKPQVGLDNIGATCYMNATLQCLCNIKRLVDYFKYNNHLIGIVKGDNNKQLLCSSFKNVMEGIYDYKRSKNYENYLLSKGMTPTPNNSLTTHYAPGIFKGTISRMNPLFEGVQANDAKDLVNFILMTLHTELNRAPQQNTNEGNLLLDQRNKQMMFNIFMTNFTQTNRSIISDLFYAMNCNMTQCGGCGSTSFNYQIYFFLIFPLEEVRKFRLAQYGMNNIYPSDTVDIFDCFNYEKKINVMGGDNAMYCNYCKQTCQSSMCTLLTTGPEILIIILNRGQGIQFNVKIIFPLELDLSHYIELQNTGCFYELIGVITHLGSSDMGGHFIAYIKSYHPNDCNRWYRFNDSLVTPVNDFNKEVVQFGMPYLLFYKKKINN